MGSDVTIPIRKIIHIDMDAFYASIEQLDNPDLKGKPIAVGGSKERGVVAAASYEARKYGVKSALPSITAIKRCPTLIFVKPRFSRYKEVSEQIREIFFKYTDLVEPLALDEAFLDVTINKRNNPSATLLAKEIRNEIFESTGLTASAGISINKFTAKIASDINKPNGQKTIAPEEVEVFLENLPIEKFFGVGKVTAEKMKKYGIHKGADLKEMQLSFLSQKFGKSGLHFYNIVRGIQHSSVKADRQRKSIAAEQTFLKDLSSIEFLTERLNKIVDELHRRVGKTNAEGKTLTLKIKYDDFSVQTRSKTLNEYFNERELIFNTSVSLLLKEPIPRPVRLLGVAISNLKNNTTREIASQLTIDF